MKSDPAYLRFVREHPCLVCESHPVDAHHTSLAERGTSGFGLRRSDDSAAVPLCRSHHMELHRVGKEMNFWMTHGVDPIDWGTNSYMEWSEN